MERVQEAMSDGFERSIALSQSWGTSGELLLSLTDTSHLGVSAATGAPTRRASGPISIDGKLYAHMTVEVNKTAHRWGREIPAVVEKYWRDWDTGRITNATRHTFDLDSFIVDQEIPDSAFMLKCPIGSTVHDKILGKSYTVTNSHGSDDMQDVSVRKPPSHRSRTASPLNNGNALPNPRLPHLPYHEP